MRRGASVATVVGLAVLAACSSRPSTAAGRSATAIGSALPKPFTITARYSAKSLGLNGPRALAIGPDGNLYVTDLRQRVSVISPRGKVLRRWGKLGSKPGEFHFVSDDPNDPGGIHSEIVVGSDGKVYVSDSGNARVEIFSPKGRFLRQFGTFGTGKGQFLGTADLAVDRDGNIYVISDTTNTLNKFSASDKFLWRIGGNDSRDPDLGGPLHLGTIDSHGRLVLTNDAKSRIVYVDRDGHKVDAFGRPSQFPNGTCGVTVDARGYTFVGGCGPGAPTVVFDRTHRLVAKWPGRRHSLQAASPFFGPHGEVFALGWGEILKLHVTLPGG